MRSRLLLFLLSGIAPFGFGVDPAFSAGDPILPLSRVHAGLDCTGKTVVQGTTISSFNVHVIDVVRDPVAGPRILVRVSGAAVDASGIAAGFSGSPVYCPDASGALLNAGAISEGVGEYGNKVGLATPIELMLGEPVRPPRAARALKVPARALIGPLTVSGVSPALASILQRAGRRAGRLVIAAPAAPQLDFPAQALVPGASVGVSYSRGVISVGALGTVTYVDGANVYAFGHPLDGAGRRSLLLEDAYVHDVVNNPNVGSTGSYKLAAPGHTLGTLTSDTPSAVIGRLGTPPPLIPVRVRAHDLDTGRTLVQQSDVVDETDVGLPVGTSMIQAVATIAVGQAAIAIYDGAPVNESGHLCFRVDIRESHRPLGFCNRYVGSGPPGGASAPPEVAGAAMGDVSAALGVLDQVQFAALHVTRMVATIDAQRGLAQATILRATAPTRVKAGRLIRASLRVRLYRGRLRTISFGLRIPASARGDLRATVSGGGSEQNPAAGALPGLASAFGGGPATSGPGGSAGPPSLEALRQAFAGIASYDGLRVSFGKDKGHGKPAYRDPNLLITGQATLRFVVTR